MDSQFKSTLELYQDTLDKLVESRNVYTEKTKKYLSQMTELDISRMKKMRFEQLHAVVPEMKFDVGNIVECDNFLNRDIPRKSQCNDSVKREIAELKENLQKLKPE